MARVVLITQDAGLRDMLRPLLSGRGHHVVTELSPVERAVDIGWRAAFIDVSESGDRGLTLVRKMRAGQPACRIAVIDRVRQRAGRRRLMRAIRLGADEFLGKPVSVGTVEALLGRLHL